MAWDTKCADCICLNVESEKNGKYLCTNPKSKFFGQMVEGTKSVHDCGEYHLSVSRRSGLEARQIIANSRKYGYYVVTAITKILGLEENNKYIAAFSYVKDVVMPSVEEYHSFIEEYDTTGPKVAEKLIEDEDAYDYAELLRVAYLEEFYELVNLERVDEAISVYKDMYFMLMQEFGISRVTAKPVTKSLYNPEHK